MDIRVHPFDLEYKEIIAHQVNSSDFNKILVTYLQAS